MQGQVRDWGERKKPYPSLSWSDPSCHKQDQERVGILHKYLIRSNEVYTCTRNKDKRKISRAKKWSVGHMCLLSLPPKPWWNKNKVILSFKGISRQESANRKKGQRQRVWNWKAGRQVVNDLDMKRLNVKHEVKKAVEFPKSWGLRGSSCFGQWGWSCG